MDRIRESTQSITYQRNKAPPNSLMASAPIPSATPRLPAETLQQICEYLNRRTLKRFRLVCKNFSYAPEPFLFRKVLLEREVQSFYKLNQVAWHPRMSQYVQCIHYTNARVTNGHDYEDFEEWSQTFRQLHSTFTTQDGNEMHHARYLTQLGSEHIMDHYQHLTHILAKLPRLSDVCFGCDVEYHTARQMPISECQRRANWSRDGIARCDFEFYSGELTIFLRAADAVQKFLNTVKVFGIPWSVFHQSKEIPVLMTAAVEACQHLTLGLINDGTEGIADLTKMISGASCLHTLEISYDVLQYENKPYIIRLSHIFRRGVHWPNLKRLKLQGIEARDVQLKRLLTDHVTCLRSLELADIDLEIYRHEGNRCRGSWVEIILFLHHSLNLESVRLNGVLSNQSDEVWLSSDPDERHNDGKSWYPTDGPCLKHRIERFVVEGGTFPLPMPSDAVRARVWGNIVYDRDWSWILDLECSQGAKDYVSGSEVF